MASAPQKRILIVDDEGAVRHPLQLAFEEDGWHVDIADSYEAAAAQLQAARFDILLTDKNLPQHSGLELVEQLRRRGDETTVLMMTAYASVDSAVDGLHLGIAGYIQKPFEDIFAVVDQARRVVTEGDRADRSESMAAAAAHFNKANAYLKSIARSGDEGGVQVLIANSHADERDWLTAHLQAGAHQVQTVRSASQLLTRVAQQPPDVVIVDLELAQPTPQALLDNLARGAPDILCVVTCERIDLETTMRLIELRVHAVLEKPFREAAFRDRVGSVLDALTRRSSAGPALQPLAGRV